MREDPDIIKILREEERLGVLTSQSQDTYEELTTSGEVFEDMSNKNIFVMKDAVEADSLFSEGKKEWSRILDAISDWVCLLDKNHRVIRTNLAVEKIIGLSPSEVIGQICCKVVHGSDKPLPGCPLEKMLLSRKRESLEIQIPDSNRWLKVTIDPVKDEKGNIIGAVHVVSNITDQKKAEEKLKESEENLAEAQHIAHIGSWNYNIQKDKLSWSEETYNIFCTKHEEFTGNFNSFFRYVHPDDKNFVKKSVDECIATGKVIDFEHRIIGPDGKVRILHESGKAFYDKKKNPIRLAGTTQDITEQKKAQVKVEHQANILQNVNDAIISVDSDFNITSWNKAAEIMYGWKEKEVLGKNSFDVTKLEYSSDNIEKSLDEQIKKFYDVGSWKGNVIQHHKNGKTLQVYVSVTFIRDAQGNPVGNVTINRDVTEQKKAEEKIKNILESSPDSIVVSDLEGNITECNEATLKLHGFSSKEELIGKSAFMFFPERDQERATENLQKALKEGSVKNIEYTLLTKDGKEFPAELSASVINDASGKPVAFVAITKDNTERKEAEEKVKTLATMVNEAKVAISTVDIKGIISTWNKTCEEMLGYSAKEMIGKIPMSKICPKAGEQIQTTFKKGYCLDNELEYIAKDGRVIPCSTSTFLMKDDAGNPIGVGGIAIDATARKKAEKKLKKSEERFKDISLSMADWIWEVDKDGIYTFASGNTKEIIGYTPEEIIGKTPFDLMPEDEAKRVGEIFKEIVNEKKPIVDLENWNLTKQGENICLLTNGIPLLSEKGELMGYRGVDKDITERKKIEERTKQQNKINTLRAEIWELAAQPLSEDELIQQLVDKVGPFFNLEHASFLRIYPEKKKAIVGIQWRKKDSKSGIGEEFSLWLLKRYFGKPYKVISLRNIPLAAKPIVAPIFKKFGVKSTLLIPYGDIDNPQGYIATADRKADKEWLKDEIDIFSEMMGIILLKSEEIKAEEQAKKHQRKIEQQNIQLKRLDRIKTDFLNTTSHELRTPMAAIKGYIQMLLKQTLGDVTPEQKDALNVVLRNTDRLDHLVQDILDISRLESGTMKFIQEKTDISKMIKESLQTMQYNADIKNIKINTELEENIPTLIIDQERIKQVIMNLVDNAIKFSPPNSTVMVRAKKDKSDVLFEVQDFGRGIPKNKQKKIFERFYQVESGMDRKFGGVGLGLTISQGIVRSHGGNIWVDNSTKDEGSTIKFNLPIDSAENIEEKFKQMDIFNLENNK